MATVVRWIDEYNEQFYKHLTGDVEAKERDEVWSHIPDKLYVVLGEGCEEEEESIGWTVSDRPDEQGWETDCGCRGYSLPKAIAEEICRRYNR